MGSRLRWLLAVCVQGACGGQTILDATRQSSSDGSTAESDVVSESAIEDANDDGDSAIVDQGVAASLDADADADTSIPDAGESDGSDAVVPWDVNGDGPMEGGFGVGPNGYLDKLGDVVRPASDVIEAAVYVSPDFLDFRLRFADTPLQPDATNALAWCIDTQQNKLEGGCMDLAPNGPYLSVSYAKFADNPYTVWFADQEYDPCTHVGYEPMTRTLRILIPRSALLDDGLFNYVVLSDFGGSGGLDDHVPDPPQVFLTSVLVSELPPFAGGPSCDPPVP